MTILDMIKQTRNVPGFQARELEGRALEELLEAVRHTPSAANTQPWEIYLVREPRLRGELDACLMDPMMTTEIGGAAVSGAPAAVVMAMDAKRAGARTGRVGEALLGIQDTAVAVAHLRLAAAERGIGTCWIREVRLEAVSRALNLPRGQSAVALILLGYSDGDPEAAPALPVSDFIHVR